MDHRMFQRKYLLGYLGKEARGDLKATVVNRVLPHYHIIHISFCSFLFLSASVLFSLAGYASKGFQHILDTVSLSQAEVRRTHLNLFDSHCYCFMKTDLRIIRHVKALKVLLATTIWPSTQLSLFH